ncbi:MAG: Uma2 family endonuclease [Chloroflexi bacterium]|nr:Uma2 family endonuclease [Chloroflexota bacterium]
MATRVELLTAEDLLRFPRERRGELVNGIFIAMAPPAPEHGGVAALTATTLTNHSRTRRLGRVLVEAGFVLRRNPDTVRFPDVAFVRAERIPPEGLPRRYWDLTPDLVGEVISPNDTPAEIEARLQEWLDAGAPLVWLLYPENRSVQAATSLLDRVRLGPDDILDGGAVLPGFSIRVGELFE